MKVNKELIEKYHSGKTSPEESALVENWLLDDDTDIEPALPKNLDKENTRNEMWDEIASTLPSGNRKVLKSRLYFSVAASIAVLLTLSYFLFGSGHDKTDLNRVNASIIPNKEIHSKDYTISLGPESNASINVESGLIDFCGAILISPKKDIRLAFNDVCDGNHTNRGEINFKKGETYIALNYRNNKDNGLVVMDEKLLMGLPPIVKRQIMDQFNI